MTPRRKPAAAERGAGKGPGRGVQARRAESAGAYAPEAGRRVALVTGSAKRLGREIALRLGARGYHVWVHWLESKAEAEDVLATIRGDGGSGSLVRGDMSRKADVAALARKIGEASGRIDVLVNNVGIYRTGPLAGFPVDDFERTLQANLVGPFHLAQRLLPFFPEGGGSIINIGYAGVESLTASDHNTAYLISKSGLYVLTKSLALALGPRGIRVNMVSPGILDNSVELPDRPSDHVPLGRLGTVADVCDAVDFLAGEKAAYVTGANLDVAGGYRLRLAGLEGAPRG